MSHHTGNDIEHLEEVGHGLFDCWCIAECCNDPNQEGSTCICPECYCQQPENEVYERIFKGQ